MKTVHILLILISVSSLAYSQTNKLKRANKYFDALAYAPAVPLYEELIGSKLDSPGLRSKLGRSYFYLGEMANAEMYLTLSAAEDSLNFNDVFYLAQALKQEGKYVESDNWMKRLHESAKKDARGLSFIENQNYYEAIKKQSPYFILNKQVTNSLESDFGGYFSNDGKKAYFLSSREKRMFVHTIFAWNNKRFLNIFYSDLDSAFQMQNVNMLNRKINTKFHEGSLCFSGDGKTVYFTRNNIDKGNKRKDQNNIQNLKLYKATVDSYNNWTGEEELWFNSKDFSVGHPSMSVDGKKLYFASDMPGGIGGVDLYSIEIFEGGKYGQPVNLGRDINTEGDEMFPWINSQNQLFFSSNGHIGLGGLDIFVAFLNSENSGNKIINLGYPINSNKDDFSFSIHPNNVNGFVSSNRGLNGVDDIYSFQLIRPLERSLILKGRVTDIESQEFISGAQLILRDEQNNEIATYSSDDQGYYFFNLDPDKKYTIDVKKDNYFDNIKDINTSDLSASTDEIEVLFSLEKDSGFSLYVIIDDHKTGQPLEGVVLTIIDNFTNEKTTIVTGETGDFRKVLVDKNSGDRGSYQFIIEKEGYFSKSLVYNAEFLVRGQYNVHEVLDFGIDKEVVFLSDMIQINPINFDLNKFNIRQVAAQELDKIVSIMNQYSEMVVELGSHTDCRASKAYNEKLSERRALASASYIKARISNPDRINGKGYGESMLLNNCACEGAVKYDCSEEEHAINRRTEFRVISTGNDKLKLNNTSKNSFE